MCIKTGVHTLNKGIIVGGIIILAGVAVSAPYFVGNTIENRFNQEVRALQISLPQVDPKLGITQENYQKGWFSSTSRVVLTINDVKIPIDNKITHGPFSYFGLGKIESSIALEKGKNKAQDEIIQLFSGQTPLLVTTKIGFSSTAIDIYSPVIDNKTLLDKPSTHINWGGINGVITVNDNRNLNANIEIPNLKIVDNNKTAVIQNTVLKAQGLFNNNVEQWANADTSSEMTLDIEKFSLNNGMSTFASKVNLISRSTDDNTYIDSDTTLKLTDIKVPKELDLDVADNNLIEFNLNFDHIPKKPLIDYVEKFQALQKQGKTPTDAEILSIVEPFMISYLQGTPSVKTHLLIKDSKKNALISFDIKLPESDPNAKTINQIIASTEDRVEATLATSFSETFLDVFEKHGKLPMPKEAFIQGLLENDRFTLNNGELSNKTEYKKGHIYVNGKPDPALDASIPYLLQSLFY